MLYYNVCIQILEVCEHTFDPPLHTTFKTIVKAGCLVPRMGKSIPLAGVLYIHQLEKGTTITREYYPMFSQNYMEKFMKKDLVEEEKNNFSLRQVFWRWEN